MGLNDSIGGSPITSKGRQGGGLGRRGVSGYNVFLKYKKIVVDEAADLGIVRNQEDAKGVIQNEAGLENERLLLDARISNIRKAISAAGNRQRNNKTRKHKKSGLKGFRLTMTKFSMLLAEEWKRLDDFTKAIFNQIAHDRNNEEKKRLLQQQPQASNNSTDDQEGSLKQPMPHYTSQLLKNQVTLPTSTSRTKEQDSTINGVTAGVENAYSMEPASAKPMSNTIYHCHHTQQQNTTDIDEFAQFVNKAVYLFNINDDAQAHRRYPSPVSTDTYHEHEDAKEQETASQIRLENQDELTNINKYTKTDQGYLNTNFMAPTLTTRMSTCIYHEHEDPSEQELGAYPNAQIQEEEFLHIIGKLPDIDNVREPQNW